MTDLLSRNAASPVDVCSIPGVLPEQAREVLTPVDLDAAPSAEDVVADLFKGLDVIMRSYRR